LRDMRAFVLWGMVVILVTPLVSLSQDPNQRGVPRAFF
jgi:hypothetical protein